SVINLEGHGREPMRSGFDLSQTVGWFTSMYPVGLDVGMIDLEDALSGGSALGRAVKQIKEQLRAVPGRGLGYGLLRYVHPEAGPRLAGWPEPQISFNYLGRFVSGKTENSAYAPESRIGGEGNAAMPMSHLVEINAVTLESPEGPRLSATWNWAEAHMKEDEVRQLTQGWQAALEALVCHVEQAGAGGHTPSDFPLVSLTQAQVERLEARYPHLEEILPLSPLQEGLMFHALYDETARDIYTVQMFVEFEGHLDGGRLRTAAEAMLKRHANLRAIFTHEGLSQPVQIIAGNVELPWFEM